MQKNEEKKLDLQSIKEPMKVKILILAENRTSNKDFYFIQKFANLIKIDLSYNKLVGFPSGFTFGMFPQIRTLLLHYNKFTSLKNLVAVSQSSSIIYLTLFGNPLEQAKTRHFFVNQMPQLMLMDDKIVRMEQRNSGLSISQKFAQPLSYPLVPIQPQDKGEKFFIAVIQELSLVRRYFVKSNPIIFIQRWWKNVNKPKKQKWKNISLNRMGSNRSNLQRQKSQLQRLKTENLLIHKSNDERVYSLLKMNLQFWAFFRTFFKGPVFALKAYCAEHQVPYKSQNSYIVLRSSFQSSNYSSQKLKAKRNLLFFLFSHKNIVCRKSSNKKISKFRLTKLRNSSINSKTHQEHQLNSSLAISLAILDERCRQRYVQVDLPSQQSMLIVRKQYVDFVLDTKKQQTQFPFLLDFFLKYIAAAVAIQRCWRGYKSRGSKNSGKQIKENKAATKIQKWLKQLSFVHRHKFLLYAAEYLNMERNRYIVVQAQQLPYIQEYSNYKLKDGINFVIPFQKRKFEVREQGRNSGSEPGLFCFAERPPCPAYLNLSIEAEPSESQGEQISAYQKSNVLDVLIKQAQQIRKFSDSRGLRHIQFVYGSIQQAKNRKFILALLTYNMKNHQFISSKDVKIPKEESMANIYNEMKEINIIKITYSEQILKKSSIQVSQATSNLPSRQSLLNNSFSIQQLGSRIQSNLTHKGQGQYIFYKLKYFHGRDNLSCLLLIKKFSFGSNFEKQRPESINQSLASLKGQSSSNPNKLGSLSRRYGDYDSITHQQSKISRSILNLNDLQPPKSQRETEEFRRILITDQSHSIISSISPHSSLKKMYPGYLKSFDKFDKEIYPATQDLRQSLRFKKQLIDFQNIRNKKQLVKSINHTHHTRIKQISLERQKSLQKLRKQAYIQGDISRRKLQDSQAEGRVQNLKKHHKIKDYFKSPPADFENKFVQMGNHSIKKQQINFEKKSKSQNVNWTQAKINRQLLDQRNTHLRTQAKQVSMVLPRDQAAEQQEMSTGLKQQIANKLKKVVLFDSRPTPQIVQNRLNDVRQIQQKRKFRKKRLVHSVFPEEFYPLKQSHIIGFQLPKIAKK